MTTNPPRRPRSLWLAPLTLVCAAALLAAPAASPARASGPTDALTSADRRLQAGERTARHLLLRLGQIRSQRDERTVRCVDRRLSEVNSFVRRLRTRRDRLEQAQARADRALAAHEASVIQVLSRQIEASARAGARCGVSPVQRDGRTVVEVELDPNLPRLEL